jgi:hypothetical protein
MPFARAFTAGATARLRAAVACVGVLGLLAGLAAKPAAADDTDFVTAKGVTVATPPVPSLDCDGMRRVLDAIDSSGYRGARPESVDPRDRDLLDYENRLSGVYYQRCVHPAIRAQPLFNAFNRGYDAQR